MLHGHGDDAYKHGGAVRLNFSSNVRPGGAPAALRAFLAARIGDIGTYPEVAAETLTARLADHHGVAPDNIIVTNGAVAGIHLIAHAWAGAASRVVTPTFAEYEDAARIHRHSLTFTPWGQWDFANADLTWLCNPNNPTGDVLDRATLLALIDRHPSTLFVVDLAYADFCSTPSLRATDATSRDNLVLIHSMTKTHGLPGLRLGYLVTSSRLRARIAANLAPWSVNALALAAGAYCLDHTKELALPLTQMLADTARLADGLRQRADLHVHPSATTFLLCELPAGAGTATELKARLIREHGILIRDAANFRGLGPGAFRVATQGPSADGALVGALALKEAFA